MILIISGPGGVGKGTLVERLMTTDDRLWLNRSWTTRLPREGESPSAYVFVDDERFQARIEAGGFLEWVDFLDYRQGSPYPEAPEGHDTVFEIDVHGAKEILEAFPEAQSVFIEAPSPEVQRARLAGRGDSPERIEQRLARAEDERRLAAQLGSVVVINDDLDEALSQLQEIVAAHR